MTKLKILVCNYRFWLYASVRRIRISTRCYGILALSISNTSRRRQSGTVVRMRLRSDVPKIIKFHIKIENYNGESKS